MPAEYAPYVVLPWMLAMVAVFPSVPPARGILLIVLSGLLFLPELGIDQTGPGMVELGPIKLGKYLAISYTGLLVTVLYHSDWLTAPNPRWFDAPMIVWCLVALPSALANDPPPDGSGPLRDALSQTLNQAVGAGGAYLLGRLYFADRDGLRELAVGAVIAAAVYAPFCLWEVRMSPHLHPTVFGYRQHEFGQAIRFGGYRPMVFMHHGLAVGLFMTVGALLAVWLRRPAGLSGYLLLLVPVAVLVKSTGVLALGLAGGAVLWASKWTGSRGWLLALVALPIVYVSARTTGLWSGTDLVEAVSAGVEEDRGRSLEFRFANENILIDRALERPLLGWGGWGRNRVRDASGRDISVTDGQWVIVLGNRGLIGLIALEVAVLGPVVRFARRTDPRTWHTPPLAPAAGCAVVIVLWTLDNLFNAMPNPLYAVMAGALAGWEPAADHGPEVGGDHPGQEQGVPGVPAGQPAWLPGDAVRPLQPGPLDPAWGPPHPAGDEVQGRPELGRHRHPEGGPVPANPQLALRLAEQDEQQVRPGGPDAAD